jgi:hypothetical protein
MLFWLLINSLIKKRNKLQSGYVWSRIRLKDAINCHNINPTSSTKGGTQCIVPQPFTQCAVGSDSTQQTGSSWVWNLRGHLMFSIYLISRSQWPHGLKHELSSPAPTLRSWVRIPLEAWVFVCVQCEFILCIPSVEAGKNTSTVISASRKGRQKGNPVVSGETASRPKRRLMRTYHWISLFKSHTESQQISL